MKKLLSLTTMAMIALTTPTLSADTTANTTKTVKKNNVSQNVDYSKMNYAQLKELVKKARKEDSKDALESSRIFIDSCDEGSEIAYKKLLNLHKKIITKRAALITEVDRRMEKYDKYHENNPEAYNLYYWLSNDIHSSENTIKRHINKCKENIDEKNKYNMY